VALANDLGALQAYAAGLLSALSDIVTRLSPDDPAICRSDLFIELAARVWNATSGAGDYPARLEASVSRLHALSAWLGGAGFTSLTQQRSLSEQLLEIYAAVTDRTPKRVFLARWYPTVADGDEYGKAVLRLSQLQTLLGEIERESGVQLALVDMGTAVGGTFPIHPRMYEAIASADIILIDLSGVRPNVCVEAGYALRHHEKGRLVFLFQPSPDHQDVPFDLNTFRYEKIADTGEIPQKLKPHLLEVLAGAARGE
jgi:hypothetical protein